MGSIPETNIRHVECHVLDLSFGVFAFQHQVDVESAFVYEFVEDDVGQVGRVAWSPVQTYFTAVVLEVACAQRVPLTVGYVSTVEGD